MLFYIELLGLTEEDLGQEVSDLHINKLCLRFCKNWRLLHSHLDLDEVVCNDVERDHFNEMERKVAFFSAWKQQKAYEATYKKLIDALRAINCHKDATALCEILAGKSMPVTKQTATSGESYFWS